MKNTLQLTVNHKQNQFCMVSKRTIELGGGVHRLKHNDEWQKEKNNKLHQDWPLYVN